MHCKGKATDKEVVFYLHEVQGVQGMMSGGVQLIKGVKMQLCESLLNPLHELKELIIVDFAVIVFVSILHELLNIILCDGLTS